MRKFVLVAGLIAAGAVPAQASLITTASLFTPQAASGATLTPISLAGVTAPSQSLVSGTGYTITFNVPSDQGVVKGALAGRHAIPVAGVSGGQATYLTGDFGSAQTTNASAAGNYLSTDGAGYTITITFATPQTSLALLWGSIDVDNRIAFNDVAGDVLTGATIQSLAGGFASNGFQGPGGSAYVSTTTNTSFTTVTLSSGTVSFELSALVGSNKPFTVPEPASIALLGMGMAGLVAARRRRV